MDQETLPTTEYHTHAHTRALPLIDAHNANGFIKAYLYNLKKKTIYKHTNHKLSATAIEAPMHTT